jgi:hypothetical protein
MLYQSTPYPVLNSRSVCGAQMANWDCSANTNYFFLLWHCDPTRVMASSFFKFLDHTQRRTTFVGLLWTSDQLVAKTSTWKHTTLTTEKHSCRLWNSNPQSQQASDRRPTPFLKHVYKKHFLKRVNTVVVVESRNYLARRRRNCEALV